MEIILTKEDVVFENLKALVVKKPVVKIFDPIKDIVVTIDASEHTFSGNIISGCLLYYLSHGKIVISRTNLLKKRWL